MKQLEQLHMDGYLTMENYRMACSRIELKPGEQREEAKQRGKALIQDILKEAEDSKREAEATSKRESQIVATERRLAEQDDKLARMEQMMAQLLAAQQKG